MNGAVDGLLLQTGSDPGPDAADADPDDQAVDSPHTPPVRNTVTGHVSGAVIQAGNVHGGLTIN